MTLLKTANSDSVLEPSNEVDDHGYRHLLVNIILLNAAMFFIELLAGIWSGSTALLADSLDMFGDALTYSISFWVLAQSNRSKYRAALFKSLLMLLLGAFVIYEAIDKVINPALPEVGIVFWVSILALAANSLVLFWLKQHQQNDINKRSVMACSYTDVVASAGVLLSAVLVWWSGYHWPDLIVGVVVAIFFLRAAYNVFIECWVSNKQLSHLPELTWIDLQLVAITTFINGVVSPYVNRLKSFVQPHFFTQTFRYLLVLTRKPFLVFLGLDKQAERLHELESEVLALRQRLAELNVENKTEKLNAA